MGDQSKKKGLAMIILIGVISISMSGCSKVQNESEEITVSNEYELTRSKQLEESLINESTQIREELSTIDDLGVVEGQEEFKLLELSHNYFPGKSILNNEEQEIYNQYRETKEETLLKDVSPVSIAKFYVQTELDNDAETQYALMEEYDPESNMMGWSKEEHLAYAKENTLAWSQEEGGEEKAKSDLLDAMGNVGQGTFVEQDHNSGYIKYMAYDSDTGREVEMGFQLVRNEVGIWKVCFMPIQ